MKQNIPTLDFDTRISEMGFEMLVLEDFLETQNREHLQKPHIVNFYIIIAIASGEGRHEIDFKSHSFDQYNLIFIHRGQEHRWEDYQSVKGYMIFFTKEFLFNNQLKYKDLFYSFPYNAYLSNPIISIVDEVFISFLKNLLSLMISEYKQKETVNSLDILQALLHTFLLKIQSNKSINPIIDTKKKALFIRFQKLIDERINQSRNVRDYALWLNVSYKSLNQLCKELTHCSAKEFLDSVIVLKSKQLIISGKYSISEISYMLGFKEPTNFTKFFKRHTNCLPKTFQENN